MTFISAHDPEERFSFADSRADIHRHEVVGNTFRLQWSRGRLFVAPNRSECPFWLEARNRSAGLFLVHFQARGAATIFSAIARTGISAL